jgi:hypothetical protein
VRILCLAAGLAAWAGVADAQTMREYTTARQLHGESRLTARLDYAAGTLRLAPGPSATLYRMRLRYDQERYAPVSEYSSDRGEVALGLRATGGGGIRVSSREHLEQMATVTLSPRADLSLDLALGAAEAEVELGGLRLSDLRIRTGASRTLVRFSKPNQRRCARAEFGAGAAELAVVGLGNSRCESITFDGGMGKVTLDFGGAWTAGSRARIRMAVGDLTLRLPRQVGIRLTTDKFLSSLDPAGLVRQGNSYVSPGYAAAPQHLDIELSTTIGGVKVEWVD